MKAYLKRDPTRIGEIEDVYLTTFGQKRLVIWLDDIESKIDAEILEFEVVEAVNETNTRN